MSHFSGSSRHHDGGDRDQTSRPGSSSTPLPKQNYEVFLSFRGEETRCGFTDHLYHGFYDKGIIVFRDNEELLVGEKIDKLLEAIKASTISIPIISSDYASSMWCLKELLQIIECNKTSGQLVLPIFYKVKPSDVRDQEGVFGEKFRLCRKNDNLDGKFVQDLQNAFEQVASMKGWESDKIADGHEGALVNAVVRRIFNELRKPILSLPDLLVGVDEPIEAIKEKFDGVPSNDAKIIVIHGMGGIGKTTLAKALYNEFFESFECQSFIPNIREASSKYKGMEGLQKQMISDILVDKSLPEIPHVDEGINTIEKRFKEKRILLLLDDVGDKVQLENLAAKRNWFGPKSVVIITTRNKNIVAAPAVNLEYELNKLNCDESFKLFYKHAFGLDACCPRDLKTIAVDIVSMTGGLPLAIEVIGSLLHKKGESFWRAANEKLRRIPNSTVHDKLKISYDALDYAQKQIFLDIACLPDINEYYFRFATYMWKGCGFYPDEGIDVLVSLSLIKKPNENHVVMHDQLKDLGREIVRNEGCDEIGKRSRIWLPEEATEVTEGKQGTSKIQALVLTRGPCRREQFEGMDKLRFLRLDGVDLIGDFESLFLNLRWFHWRGCYYRDGVCGDIMGINFNPKKLVILHLQCNNITEYWKGWSQMKDLKVLTIIWSGELTAIPDLSAVNELEYLALRYCQSVMKIHPSIGRFSKTLKTLIVYGCKALEELPLEVGKMEELRCLNIRNSGIKEIPISDGYMQKLETLDASFCKQLISIPDSIGKLKLLTELCLSYTGVTQLPDSVGDLYNLKELLIDHTPIKCFPTSFGKLSKLGELDLEGCRELESLSNLPCNLSSLKFHGDSMETLTDISKLTILKHLTYWDLFEKRNKVLNVGKLNQLESLKIQHSGDYHDLDKEVLGSQEEIEMAPENFTLLPELPSSLVELNISHCQTLRTLSSLSNLKNLSGLELEDYSELMEINILGAESLTRLEIKRCKKLSRLGSISNLKNLSSLDLEDCSELMEIDILEGAESLRHLHIRRCGKLSRLGSVSNLKNLSWLHIEDCSELMEINILEGAESLRRLHIRRCGKLSRLGSVSNLKNLSSLHLGDFSELEINILEGAESLIHLRIERCGKLSRLGSVSNLKNLSSLHLEDCSELEINILGPESLTHLRIERCGKLSRLGSVSNLKNLSSLHLKDCSELMEINILEGAESLRHLHIRRCGKLSRLGSVSNLKNLSSLDLEDCSELMEINILEGAESLTRLEIKRCKKLSRLGSVSNLKNLSSLDLEDCSELMEINILEGAESLTHLHIRRCGKLSRLGSISNLKNLSSLDLEDCSELMEINILEGAKSLRHLHIRRCGKLSRLGSVSNLKNLSSLDLEDCSELMEINILEGAESLRHLHIRICGKLSRLGSVSNLKNLSSLDLEDCSELMEIDILEGAESLRHLHIRRCGKLSRLGSVSNLKNLSSLDLEDCSELMEIDILEGAESLRHSHIRLGNLSSLKMLKALSLHGCEKLSDVEGMEKLTSLTSLSICGCNPNSKFPDLSMLKNLEYLAIMDAELMEIPWLQELKSLTELTISSKSLQYLPDLSHLTKLSSLDISGSEKLIEIRGIENMKSLSSLSIEGCTALRKLPDLSMLRNLESLTIKDVELMEIPCLQELKSLTELTISSKTLQYLPDLSHFTKLSLLDVSGSEKLIEIRGIENMKSLEFLSIKGCIALRKLPDLPDVDIHSDGSDDGQDE